MTLLWICTYQEGCLLLGKEDWLVGDEVSLDRLHQIALAQIGLSDHFYIRGLPLLLHVLHPVRVSHGRLCLLRWLLDEIQLRMLRS